MKRFLLAMIAMTLLFAIPAWADVRAGSVTMEFDLSVQPAGEVVRLWIPYPVSNQDQLISKIRFDGDYAEAGVYTVPADGTPLLYAEWPRGSKSRKLVLAFEVMRDELRRTDFPAREPAWNPADYEEYLAPTSIGPTDGAVKELADKIVAGKRPCWSAPGRSTTGQSRTCTATPQPSAAARAMSATC